MTVTSDIRAIDPLERELVEELETIQTVDAHEHLPPECSRIGVQRDFYTLFEHYCRGDLVAAGATNDELQFFADRDQPLGERWKRFKPFFEAIRTGAYARSALLVIRDLLGIDELTEQTYPEVGARLTAMNKEGLYEKILREHCNLAACIACWCLDDAADYPDYFYHLAPSPQVLDLTSEQALSSLGRSCNRSIHSLDDALACMTEIVERWAADPRVVGIKVGHAYQRSLAFQKVTRHEAEMVFNCILTNEGHQLSGREAIPLQDFLLFQLVARADAVALPMVFHTGLQAGNLNRVRNADPLLLQTVLEEFPRAKFDLFHGGMPWVREIAVLAKYFPNVHLNMAWMHIISPAQARSALSEWLDMVPNTKIFGFGGDYGIVEKVYGHLVLARQNIAAVLAEKIHTGAFSRSLASQVAQRLMFDNPNRFYGLGL